jgi:hypothetical protein
MSKVESPITILTILHRSTPFDLLFPSAMAKHTPILNAVYPPQFKSFEGLSIFNLLSTNKK